MKKYLLLSCLLLTGCFGTNPVLKAPAWPDPPGKLAMQECPNLTKLKENPELSDVASTVVLNYGSYYECAVKTDAWIEWYKVQKSIYEEATK